MSAAPPRKFSRTYSVFAGALTGLALAIAGMLAVLLSQDGPGPQEGALALVLLLLHGTVLIGSVFAFPTALAMVLTLAGLFRWWPQLDRAWFWALAGVVFTMPTAFFFNLFDSPFPEPPGGLHLGPLWWFGLALGGLSGLSAWKFGRLDKANHIG